MGMFVLLVLMLSCYWLVFGLAEIVKHLDHHQNRHQH